MTETVTIDRPPVAKPVLDRDPESPRPQRIGISAAP